jgi:hypothetical protein
VTVKSATAVLRRIVCSRWTIQFAITISGVFLALVGNESLQDRTLQRSAHLAHQAVVTELEANLSEFKATEKSVGALTETFSQVVRKKIKVVCDLRVEFPDVSTTAWRAAQARTSDPHFDYDWLLQVSKAYELYEEYVHSRREFYDHFVLVSARQTAGEVVEVEELADIADSIFGHLVLITGLHQQVQVGLREALKASR